MQKLSQGLGDASSDRDRIGLMQKSAHKTSEYTPQDILRTWQMVTGSLGVDKHAEHYDYDEDDDDDENDEDHDDCHYDCVTGSFWCFPGMCLHRHRMRALAAQTLRLMSV